MLLKKSTFHEIITIEESGSLFLMYILEKKKKAALWQFFLPFLKRPGVNFSVHEIQQSEKHYPPWLCTGQFFSLEPLHISLKQCSPSLSLKFISAIFYILHTRLCYTASLTVHKYASIYIMVLRFWMLFLNILTTWLNPFPPKKTKTKTRKKQ